jgi:predicted nucleic acid-binding protein
LRICVDTTILIDILKDEFRPFQEKLYEAIEKNETLVTPSVVYGELMPQFRGDEKEASAFLADHKIEIEPLDKQSVAAAVRAWIKYLPMK